MIPSFDQTKKSLLIKNPTGLILNIFRVMPEEVGKEQRGGGNIIYLIEQIYPNESINIAINTDQPHFYYFVSGAGLLWSNELTYDWTIVDKLDWTAGIDQYQIKLRVLDASSPAPIKVTNVTNMELSIEQLDYSAKFRRVGLLAPGKIYEGTAYVNQPHVLRDTHSGAIVYFFYPSAEQVFYLPFLNDLMPLRKVKPTRIRFVNCEDENVYLSKFSYPCNKAGGVSLDIGQTYEETTHTGHAWKVESRRTWGSTPPAFLPNAEEFQTCYIIDKSKSIDLSFSNETNLMLKAYKKVGDNRYLVGYIAPKDTLFRPAYPDSAWEFTAEVEGVETAVIHELQVNTAGTYPITGNVLKKMSQQGLPQRTVNLTNKSSVALKIQKKSDALLTVFEENLAANSHINFTASIGEAFEVRDAQSGIKVTQILIPPGEGDYTYSIEIKSLNSLQSSKLRINNHTKLLLDLIWLDYEGKEVKFSELLAGGTTQVATFLGHPWLIKDNRSGRVLKRIYGYTKDEIVDIYESSIVPVDIPLAPKLKSLNHEQPSSLTINNHTNLLLELIWLDYEGNENNRGDVTPEGVSRLETYLTHKWLIKDKKTKKVLKQLNGDVQDEVVDIYQSTLVPEITFNNTLPFSVDLFEIYPDHTTHFAATVSAGKSYSLSTLSAVIRIKDHTSQAEIDSFVLSDEMQQQFNLELKKDINAPDTEVEVFNRSVWDLNVLSCDEQNNLIPVASVATRMSQKLPQAKVGQSFVLQEKKSQKIVGFFTGTVKPLQFNFTGLDLQSTEGTIPFDQIIVSNKSSYQGNIYWVDFQGTEIDKGLLAPNAELNIKEARAGYVYVFRQETSNVLLDQFVIGDSCEGTIELNPQLVSKTQRDIDNLWSGEVALFNQPNFQGESFIFHTDLYLKEMLINDNVQSIKLGPGTALTAFENSRFKGVNDVFYMDTPDLRETDVKHELSSFQISTMAPENTHGISAISRLTEEPFIGAENEARRISYRSVFRTTIQFPPTVSAVDIYATEETSFEIGGKKYTADPVKSARIVLGNKTQLVITTAAQQMDQAIFMLRANTMQPDERFFVFQDLDLYKKIAGMESNALVKDKSKLKLKDNCTDGELMGVQTALQNLATTMPAVHGSKANGRTTDLFVLPDTMQYNSWGLNFGGSSGASFMPLSEEDVKKAAKSDDHNIVRRNLDTEVGQFFGSFKNLVSDTVDSVSSVVIAPAKFVSSAAEEVAGAAHSGISAMASGIVDTAQAIESAGVAAANSAVNVAGEAINKGTSLVEGAVDMSVAGITEAGGLIVEGAVNLGSGVIDTVKKMPGIITDVAVNIADEVGAIGKDVLRVVITIGEEIVEFSLDTVDKVKACMEMIAGKVFSAISSVIDYLKDLFNLEDILDTKDILVDYINKALNATTKKILPQLESKVEEFLNLIEGIIVEKLNDFIADFSSDLKDTGEDEPGIFDEAKDKIGWILDKILGANDDNDSNVTQSDQEILAIEEDESNELLNILNDLKEKLLEILNTNGRAFINSIIDGIESLTDALTGKGNPVNRIVVGILSIVKGLAYLGLGIFKVLSTLLFSIIKLIVVFIKKILNTKIQIPFLSDLYKQLTDNDLTALELISLIIAAPATILTKIFLKKSPRELMSPAGQSTGALANVFTFFSAAHQLVVACFDPILSLYYYNKKGSFIEVSKDKMKDLTFGVMDCLCFGLSLLGFILAIPGPIVEEREDSNLALSILGWVGILIPLGYTIIDFVPIAARKFFPETLVDEVQDNLKIATSVLGGINLAYVIGQIIADSIDVNTNNNKVDHAKKLIPLCETSKVAFNAQGELVKLYFTAENELFILSKTATVNINGNDESINLTANLNGEGDSITIGDSGKYKVFINDSGELNLSDTEGNKIALKVVNEFGKLRVRKADDQDDNPIKMAILYSGELARAAVSPTGKPVKMAFNKDGKLIEIAVNENGESVETGNKEELISKLKFNKEGKIVSVINLNGDKIKTESIPAWSTHQLVLRSIGSFAAATTSFTKFLLMKKLKNIPKIGPALFPTGFGLHAVCNLAAAGILIERAATDDV